MKWCCLWQNSGVAEQLTKNKWARKCFISSFSTTRSYYLKWRKEGRNKKKKKKLTLAKPDQPCFGKDDAFLDSTFRLYSLPKLKNILAAIGSNRLTKFKLWRSVTFSKYIYFFSCKLQIVCKEMLALDVQCFQANCCEVSTATP